MCITIAAPPFVVNCDHTYDSATGILTINCNTPTPGQQITGVQYSVDDSQLMPGS